MLPPLSHHFHLTPVDVWDMCPDELAVYLDELDRMAREAKKQQSRARRRRPRRR